MPAPDHQVAVIAAALSDLTSALVPTTHTRGSLGIGAPDDLQRALNGGTDAHIGAHYADLIVRDRHLPPNARILDLGCGYGRVALDLAERLSADQQYFGLDPHAEAIEWATQNIGSTRENFTFARIDVVSEPYNPDGSLSGARFRFPFDDQSLDRVFMISVLTHVDLDTVRNYLEEASRVLKRDTGRLVATVFLLDDEVDRLIADGRSAYRLDWRIGESRVEDRRTPELVIAHPRSRVEEIMRDAGFTDVGVTPGHWSGRPATNLVDFQDALIADFGTVTAAPLDEAQQEEETERERIAAFLAENHVTPETLAPFLVWALGALINVVRWEAHGIGFDLSAGGHGDLPALSFGRMRAIDVGGCIPQSARAEEFVPISESALLEAVRLTEHPLDRPAVVALLAEVAENGVALDRALRAGRATLRVSPGVSRPAPIPVSPAGEPVLPRAQRRGILAIVDRLRGR